MSKLLEQINSFQKYQVRLGDLLDVRDGTHDTPQRQSQGYQLITSKQIKGGKIDQTDYLISEDDFNEVNKRSKVDQWDILVSMIGTVGEVLLIKEEPSFAIKNIGLIKTNKNEFLARYIYYYLTSLVGQNEIRANLSGTSQQFISLGRLRDIEINIPKKQRDQEKIASILSLYDEKIENNNKIIKNLEATAQTIFNEWFVNFKFPGYEKVKMVDSKMGEIPEGWEVKALDEIADFLNGIASQKYPATNQKESLPVIKIREMNSGIDQNSDRATKDLDDKYIIKNGDTLFSWSGSLKLMLWVGGEGVLNQHIFKVTSEDYPKWFFYQWIAKHLQNFKTIAEGKATTMGHIQRHHLSESLVVVPNKSVLEKAGKIMSCLFEQQIFLQEENISLKSQRGQLLAKLI